MARSNYNPVGSAVVCPKCGAGMQPMKSGKGYRCSKAGRWSPKAKKWSGCDGTLWNSQLTKQPKVERPADFPTIANPTEEQTAIREFLSKSPTARGARCLLINAGPGTGKTTTMAWSVAAIFERIGSLGNWSFLAFNRNARDVLLSKLPTVFAGINTLNGHFGNAQGYTYRSYDSSKLYKLYKEDIAGLPEKEVPGFGGFSAFVDRMRDVFLYSDNADPEFWEEAIDCVVARFGSLMRTLSRKEKAIRELLPGIFLRASRQGKTIDIGEQISNPAIDAIRLNNWKMPPRLVDRTAEWTNDDVRHFATLIKSIDLPQQSLIVDEGQDMSLPIVAAVLAQTWRFGELVIVGDDRHGNAGEPDYQAGQGIYGWRGAGGGMFELVGRLWAELTGESAKELPLTVSFRCSPPIVESFKSLNAVLRSGRTNYPDDSGTYLVNKDQAFTAWLNLADNKTALWITRKNAPLGPLLMKTIKEGKQCAIRGGSPLASAVDSVLKDVSGLPLDEALDALREIIAETEEIEAGDDSLESFLLFIGEAILHEPSILGKADLKVEASVAAIKELVAYYNDRDAPRVLSTVYRCKGDEADIVIMDDGESMNMEWNDDDWEAAACRHVAASRARDYLLLTSPMSGVVSTGKGWAN